MVVSNIFYPWVLCVKYVFPKRVLVQLSSYINVNPYHVQPLFVRDRGTFHKYEHGEINRIIYMIYMLGLDN